MITFLTFKCTSFNVGSAEQGATKPLSQEVHNTKLKLRWKYIYICIHIYIFKCLSPSETKHLKAWLAGKYMESERCTDPVMMLLTTGPSQVSLWMLCGCEAVLDRCTRHHTHFALRIQNRSVANIRKDLRSKAAKCSLLWRRKPRHAPLHGVLSFGTTHVHTVEHICFVNFCVRTNQSWCQQVCMLIGSK